MVIIVEGVDRVGKSTLVNKLQKLLNAKVIHSQKIDKEEDAKKYYKDLLSSFENYKDEVLICDRCHLGEIVYSPIYRNYSGLYVYDYEQTTDFWNNNVYLFLLTDTPENLRKRDDGNSLDINKLEEEIQSFNLAFEGSNIKNKFIVDSNETDFILDYIEAEYAGISLAARKLLPLYKELAQKVANQDFVENKDGSKMVEILGATAEIPLDCGGYINFKDKRYSPIGYVNQEKKWYLSEDLKINQVNNVKIWNDVSDINKSINSNYGYLVFGRGNFSQFTHVKNSLIMDKNTRQAIIIYTRPSIQVEWNDLDCHDFICTNFQHFFIRNNKLYCIVNMRSNDCIFGTFNDMPWFFYVAKRMYKELLEYYPDLKLGTLKFSANSFHCYERFFNKLAVIAN